MNVPLRFAQPTDNDLVALVVYESAALLGPFVQIDRTTDIGTYPDYITAYTTPDAADVSDWFTIAWEGPGSEVGSMSEPIQGGTTTLIAIVMDRVSQRDRQLDLDVIRQEAESAIEYAFAEDPYTADIETIPIYKRYRTLNGLTYLTLARCYMIMAVTQNLVESATLGFVSFKSQSGSIEQVNVQALIDRANADLGLNTSTILQMTHMYECHPEWIQWWVDFDALPWITGIEHP